MTHVSLSMVYTELKSLHKDIEIVKQVFIPQEKITGKERGELKQIFKEMKAGKRKSFKEVFND